MPIEPRDWPVLHSLIDEWMDLPEEQRTNWLADVESRHPDLKPTLRELLAQPRSDFLSTLPKIDSLDPLAAGMRAGPYQLERELGRGGMGVVWLATRADGAVKRKVAIKLPYLHLDSEGLRSRFERERDILAKLEDARIARLYDAGITAEDQPYLVLEFVEGEPVTTYCDRVSLDARARLRLFLEVLGAVQYAHANLVVHRDLKPSNILVTSAGQVRLLDFGIAKFLEDGESAETDITRAAGRAMTPGYASPEQVAGRTITIATDVYSLGVLLHELITGARPGKPSRLLRGDLETIVLKAIQDEPQARYATADAFAQDIERFLSGLPVMARPESGWYRTRKFVLRNKLAVSASTIVLIAAAVGTSVIIWQKRRADTEAATARAVSDFLQKDLLAQAGSEAQASPGNKPDPDLKVRSALDRAAARVEGKFRAQPVVEAAIHQTIGDAYRELGLYAESERQMQLALSLREKTLGPANPDTWKSMESLAEVYQNEGKYAPAEALLTKLVKDARDRRRDDSLEAISAAHTLASIAESSRADHKTAEEGYTRVLAIERRVLGEDDTTTQATMNNLAAVLARDGKFAASEELYKKVVESKRRTLGPDHPRTLTTMNGLGVLYRYEGKYQDAEFWLKGALDGRTRTMGAAHRDTLASMNGLGLLYAAEGKYSEAEPLLTEASQTAASVLGEDNPDTQSCQNNLADLYDREGKLKESSAAFQRLLEARLRVYGPDNAFTAGTWSSLGDVKFQLRAFSEASALLQRAVDYYQKHKNDTWRRYYTECLLGASLGAQGKHAEGKAMLTAAYKSLKDRAKSVPSEYRFDLDRAGKLSAK
jgi:serine/threonine protein kinase